MSVTQEAEVPQHIAKALAGHGFYRMGTAGTEEGDEEHVYRNIYFERRPGSHFKTVWEVGILLVASEMNGHTNWRLEGEVRRGGREVLSTHVESEDCLGDEDHDVYRRVISFLCGIPEGMKWVDNRRKGEEASDGPSGERSMGTKP